MDICDIYDFDILIKELIRILIIRVFCLDVIFLNVFMFMKLFGVIEIGISDYLLVYMVFKIKMLYVNVEVVKKWIFKIFNWDDF